MYFFCVPVVLGLIPICCTGLLCFPIICPGCCRGRSVIPRSCRWDSAKSVSRLSTDSGVRSSATSQPGDTKEGLGIEGYIPEEDYFEGDYAEQKGTPAGGIKQEGDETNINESISDSDLQTKKELKSEGADELEGDESKQEGNKADEDKGGNLGEESKEGDGSENGSDKPGVENPEGDTPEGDKPEGNANLEGDLESAADGDEERKRKLKELAAEFIPAPTTPIDHKSVLYKPQTSIIDIEVFKPTVEFNNPERTIIPSSTTVGTDSVEDLGNQIDPGIDIDVAIDGAGQLVNPPQQPPVEKRDSATP
ncbi:unnamed protein product [Chrysodeixis includens]|uniref:Uncharacterized protein n=1 Tax=Chrysodeixis includens TaxID=689277 RepID=A0A9P0BZS4_CHRIL|nr:unnamed protein product [Chrysodeixis includens]